MMTPSWFRFLPKPPAKDPPLDAPTQPTIAEIDVAREDWLRSVRQQGVLVVFVALATYSTIELLGNLTMVNRLIDRIIKNKVIPSRQWEWDTTVAISDSDIILVVTALVLMVATITIAVIATPPVSAERTLYDQVLMISWSRIASKLGVWVTGLAIGAAATRAFGSPALLLLLLFVIVPVGVLSVITVQRARDQQAVELEEGDLNRANLALRFMDERGYTEDRQQNGMVRFFEFVMLTAGSGVAVATAIGLIALAALGPEAANLKAWLQVLTVIGLLAIVESIVLFTFLRGCLFWRWSARARGRRWEAWSADLASAAVCVMYLGAMLRGSPASPELGHVPGWVILAIIVTGPLIIYTLAGLIAAVTGKGPVASAAWAARSSFTEAKRLAQGELDRHRSRQQSPR